MTGHPSQQSDPYRQVTLTVEGPRAADLVDDAVRQAAVFLHEKIEDLYAAEVGNATVIRRSKWRQHLGVPGHPTRWSATIKVRLKPEVVKARRGEQDPEAPKKRGGLHILRPPT